MVDRCTIATPLTYVLRKAACCKRARKWRQEQEQRGGKEVGSVRHWWFCLYSSLRNRVLASV